MQASLVTIIRRCRDAGGITLLEATIALMILGFVLTSTMAVASYCYRYLTDIRRSANSSQMLQQQMEDIRLMTWSQVLALPATFTNTNYPWIRGRISIAGYSSSDFGPTSVVMNVTLTATWTNRAGNICTNSLATLVSNGGLNRYIF